MNIKTFRLRARMTQQQMAERFEIPKRTIEHWDAGTRKCPTYVEKLIIEKLEDIIMNNAKETLMKAMKMDEYNQSLPELEIGEVVKLKDVWNGEGDVPVESYSYNLNENDAINYIFKYLDESILNLIYELDGYSIEYRTNMDKILDAEVIITSIELI